MATATLDPSFIQISETHYCVNGVGYNLVDRVTHIDVEKLTDDGLDVVETYTVGMKAGKCWCSCPDHNYRQRECKHVRMVKAYMRDW